MKKLWGGRFSKETSSLVDDFHSSISFDQRLYREDIRGSQAHATMLGEQGIISPAEAELLVNGLSAILVDIEAGKIEFDLAAEDIHMNVEQLLIARLGPVGKKLHTGRSRNDQVALDLRLYMRSEITGIQEQLLHLLTVLVDLGDKHIDTVMPGYTHLQRAQPVTLAHHLLAYSSMFKRDHERLTDVAKRLNVCPLGAGALAGTTYNLAPARVAELLEFDEVALNSMDAVSDRDYVVEFCAAASLIMMHLSRFSEEIILWSSAEYSFIDLDDAYSTGSSIMPQKKNPDVAELVRGKTGRVYGDLFTLLTLMKWLPLAYNKDMQEDKEAVFDAIDTVKACLLVFPPMLETMNVKAHYMRRAAEGGYTNATDLADYLAKKGIPFREAHEIVGHAVLYAIKKGQALSEISLAEYQQWSTVFTQDLYQAIDINTCVQKREVLGGPAPTAVRQALAHLRAWIRGVS